MSLPGTFVDTRLTRQIAAVNEKYVVGLIGTHISQVHNPDESKNMFKKNYFDMTHIPIHARWAQKLNH
jgi:hypothetical protein